MTWVWLGVLCYAIGSLPTAYLFTRYILGQDIWQIGDFNSGAANVFRNVGAKAGVAVGAIDIIKGALVIVLAMVLVDNTRMEMMAGAAALAGHNLPVHLRFRGGRGAATAVGILIASVPIIGLPIGALCLVLLYLTHRAIYPLVVFLVVIPVLTWSIGYPVALAIYVVAIPIAVGLSHLFTTRIRNPGTAKNIGESLELTQK
ncbi:Acyl-phosphate:glycerol-3-phosphate O-acyltransferase PlsY [hydrothermal vent metagenome]|uniref:Acyl-phosphate:glycerol-3-phosphate O-acyltransferase PlsY n=1 Tax=hydrothermal vent metagenome TaxID=652676 RepID=A0A160VBR6_9ZZZZ